MRTYQCSDCGCVERLAQMIPDCCSLCGNALEQVGGPPEPDDELPCQEDFYAGVYASELDDIVVGYR